MSWLQVITWSFIARYEILPYFHILLTYYYYRWGKWKIEEKYVSRSVERRVRRIVHWKVQLWLGAYGGRGPMADIVRINIHRVDISYDPCVYTVPYMCFSIKIHPPHSHVTTAAQNKSLATFRSSRTRRSSLYRRWR